MHIKSLIIPFEELVCVGTNETIGAAIEKIDTYGHLSLPVIDENNYFVGVISKGYIYEDYFHTEDVDKSVYLQKKVHEFIKKKIPTVDPSLYVDEAAYILFEKRLRFLPVVSEKTNKFKGIVTSGNLLRSYKHIYGANHARLVIYINDFKGKLAQILNIISRVGGNIRNIVQVDTETMGLQEVTLRVESKEIKKIVKNLQNQGYEVREFTE